MNRCGSSSYQKLGISPIFAIAGMNETGFRMEGEEFITHTPGHGQGSYHYSFEKVNGQVVFENHFTNETIELEDVSTFSSVGQSTHEFDPENHSTGFEPTACVSGNDTIYVLVESVGTNLVQRIVYKTRSFKLPNGTIIADPRYIRLCDLVQGKPTGEVDSLHFAPGYGEYGLLVPPDKQASFEAGVASYALDHIWMSQHVHNYESIFSCNMSEVTSTFGNKDK